MLRASLRSVLAHKARLAGSLLAIVLGVAFVAGTLIFSDTINTALTGMFTASSADVNVSPKQAFPVEVEDQNLTGAIPTLPADTVAKVAATPGVRTAHGEINVQNLTVVDGRNQPIGPTNGAPTLGQNWYPREHPMATVSAGHPPNAAGEIALDQASAAAKNVHLGDQVRVLNPSGSFPATVVGLARFTTPNPGTGLVFFDTATAQMQLLGKKDTFTGISVDTTAGTPDTVVQQRIQATLGPGFTVQTKEEQAASAASQVGAFLSVVTYALLGFAGIAVLVGIFLILNTFSMLVAQRTRELGLLRAIGASRRQVTRSVLIEALLLGVIGSTLGLAGGMGLAAGLKLLLGTFGVDLSGTPLVFQPTVPAAAYAVGVLVTLVAAYLPARRASQIAPMAALRQDSTPPARRLIARTLLGLVLLAAGGAALFAATIQPVFTNAAVLLGAGMVGTLIALVALGPLVVRVVVYTLGVAYPLLFGAIGRLSQRNAVRNPRRTGATAAALMIGVAVASTLAVIAGSLNTSIHQEVASTFGADYVVSDHAAQPLPPEVTNNVRGIPGVSAVTRQRYAPAEFQGFQVSVSGVDTATIDQAVRTQYVTGSTASLARGQLSVDQSTANANHLVLGSVVHLRFVNGNTADLTVGAISKPPPGGGKDGSVFQVSLDTLTRYVPQSKDFTLYVNTAPGADKAAVGGELNQALAAYPQAGVQSQADYQQALIGQVDLVLELLYGLLGLAIVIAVLGVINTLTLSTVERVREIGLLRAVGASRWQIRRLIRLESVVIAVHGALLGLGLGLAWGVAGQKVLVAYGVTALTIPWSTIGIVLGGAALVGLVAAVLPAYRAARLNVLAAIATE